MLLPPCRLLKITAPRKKKKRKKLTKKPPTQRIPAPAWTRLHLKIGGEGKFCTSRRETWWRVMGKVWVPLVLYPKKSGWEVFAGVKPGLSPLTSALLGGDLSLPQIAHHHGAGQDFTLQPRCPSIVPWAEMGSEHPFCPGSSHRHTAPSAPGKGFVQQTPPHASCPLVSSSPGD